jgi:hypothetical protein
MSNTWGAWGRTMLEEKRRKQREMLNRGFREQEAAKAAAKAAANAAAKAAANAAAKVAANAAAAEAANIAAHGEWTTVGKKRSRSSRSRRHSRSTVRKAKKNTRRR